MYKIKRNCDTAEFVGLSFGDGGFTHRKNTNKKRYQLRGDLKEEKEFYDNHVIPNFNKNIMLPVYGREVGVVFNKKKNFYGLSVEGILLEKPLKCLGILLGVKNELIIPKWIKNNKTFCISFLRGFLDTDGCVHCEKNYSLNKPKYHTKIKISLSTTSKNLAKELQGLLNKLKIKNFIRRYVHKNKSWKDCYTIKIDGGVNVIHWFRKIGTNNPKHKTKFDIWAKHGFCPPNTNLKERRKIIKGMKSISDYYAEMPERSNGPEISEKIGQTKDLVA